MATSNIEIEKRVKYIIKATPYGETEPVMEDLRNLVKNMNLEENTILNPLKESNENHFTLVDYPNEPNKFVITPYNSNGEYYVDQRLKRNVYANHYEHRILNFESSNIELDEKVEQYRSILDTHVAKYVDEYFADGISGYIVFAKGTIDNYTIHITITGKNINLKNLYAGEWSSDWTLTNDKIHGTVKINTHNFEDGNVLLKQGKSFEKIMKSKGSFEADAKDIIDYIKQNENTILRALDSIYNTMCYDVFKPIRRTLPCMLLFSLLLLLLVSISASLIASLIDSLLAFLIVSLIAYFIASLIDSLLAFLIASLLASLIVSLIAYFIASLIDSLLAFLIACLIAYLIAYSFTCLSYFSPSCFLYYFPYYFLTCFSYHLLYSFHYPFLSCFPYYSILLSLSNSHNAKNGLESTRPKGLRRLEEEINLELS